MVVTVCIEGDLFGFFTVFMCFMCLKSLVEYVFIFDENLVS